MDLSHITIMTKKLEESIRFYQEAAGLHLIRDMRGKGSRNIVFLSDDKENFAVELVEECEDLYQVKGISIGFRTENLERKKTELEKAGISTGPVIAPNPVTRFFFVQDPNGVNIQFIRE